MNDEIEISEEVQVPRSGKIKCRRCKGTNIGWIQEGRSNPMMVCLDCEESGLNQ